MKALRPFFTASERRLQRGMSMLELVLILGALAALITALSYKTTDYFTKSQALDESALLQVADRQLRQYIVANGRLPCPDTNGDGYADGETDGLCNNAQKGYLPYKTLGMLDKNYVYGEVPMLYGAYNQANLSFTMQGQTFFPTYQDKENAAVQVTTTRNIFDFCATLADLSSQASVVSAGLGVGNNSTRFNAVYALAVPGQSDRDAASTGWAGSPTVNAQYDGRNATSPNLFELPQALLSPTYDDKTFFRSAPDLLEFYRCKSMNSAVSLLAEAVTVQKETEDLADGNAEDVARGLLMSKVGTAISVWGLLTSGAAIAEASEEIGISTGLLAAVTASCPIPPWVTCALIPVYTAALSSGTTGMGLAIAASALAAAQVGLNATGALLYADLKARTSTVPATPADTISNISTDRLKELLANYVSSKAKAVTAFGKLPVPAPTDADIAAAQTQRDNKLSTLNNNVNSVTDSALQGALRNNLNGSSATCTPSAGNTCAGYTARSIPVTDANGKIVTNSDGTPQMTTLYTKDLTSSPFSPGVAPALANYYGALAQQGAKPTATTVPSGASQAVADAINNSNASLASAPTVDPATALGSANTVVSAYGSLLTATANFDQRNLDMAAAQSAYNTAVSTFGAGSSQAQAAQATLNTATSSRQAARDSLRTAMGDSSWDTNTTTSLCGGGSTSGCGWMNNTTGSAGSANSLATTGSSATNDYISANANYESLAAYKKLKDAADTAANSAWSDRNTLKTGLCAVATPSAQFIGTSSIANADPAAWDQSENVLATDASGVPAPVGLSCVGGGTPADTSSSSAAAAAAEKTKYCTTGSSTYDAGLCAAYSGTGATRSTIRGADAITNTLIQKGIAK